MKSYMLTQLNSPQREKYFFEWLMLLKSKSKNPMINTSRSVFPLKITQSSNKQPNQLTTIRRYKLPSILRTHSIKLACIACFYNVTERLETILGFRQAVVWPILSLRICALYESTLDAYSVWNDRWVVLGTISEVASAEALRNWTWYLREPFLSTAPEESVTIEGLGGKIRVNRFLSTGNMRHYNSEV